AITRATEDLNTYIQKIGEEMQKKGQQQGGAPGPDMGGAPGHEPPKKENSEIEEAEIEVLDDDEK
ncbi:MAG: molecular chaperone DnaK, partial [Chlamydiia bacterium]|nr:molecular chaperone DnaK [Chlamydiia bacterium]